ncbi:MAG: hypothetical protein GY785_02265 [Gammaproteobacteria bacterium]|nr:hypothetical protein [Gammaproteobacteria bacterium]
MKKSKSDFLEIKALTANIAGGKPADERKPDKLGSYIKSQDFDFVCCQEASLVRYDNDSQESLLETVQDNAGNENFVACFAVSVDTTNNPCPEVVPGTKIPGKWYSSRFINTDVPTTYVAQGNGFLVSSRWEIVDLFGSAQQGSMATTVVSGFGLFLGDRETEPRIFSVIRARHKELDVECFIGNTHLTTCREENEQRLGSDTRSDQIRRILQVCNDLPKGIPIILAGDFNAELSSPELNLLKNAGYLAATDRCSKEDKEAGTHRGKNIFIDHFFYSSDARVSFNGCGLADIGEFVSDHNPVMFSFSVPVK